MQFYVKEDEIDLSGRFPAPLYVKHNNNKCNGMSTVYFDSELRVSLIYKGLEDCSKWKFVNKITSVK